MEKISNNNSKLFEEKRGEEKVKREKDKVSIVKESPKIFDVLEDNKGAIDKVRCEISSFAQHEESDVNSSSVFSINLDEEGLVKRLPPLAVSLEGSAAWKIARIERLARDFLTSIKPIIDNKIKKEMEAGTLSGDEARELISMLSINNREFWEEPTLYHPRENKERLIAFVEQFSAKEFLDKNRTTKRKLVVLAQGLFKKITGSNKN